MANEDQNTTEMVGAAEEHSSGGLPQLDPATWAPQIVWLLISFVFLYVMMSRVALPRIGSVIEERRDKIADDLDRASELKKEAEDALAAYEQALAEARAKAHAIASETREAVKAETEALKADNDAKIAEQMAKAEAQIKETKETALSNVKDVASETAALIVEKILGDSADTAAADRAVDAELNQS